MSTKATTIEGKRVLVTGANRGLGQALVSEALLRGAARVYAGTRGPLLDPDKRVTPLTLDITEPSADLGGGREVGLARPPDQQRRRVAPRRPRRPCPLEQHLAVNLYGTWEVTAAHSCRC